MLSKAPVTQEKDEAAGNSIPQEMQADKKIAAAMLTNAFLSEQGEQSVVAALSSPEPEKAMAMVIAQIMEMTLTESMNTDTPMSPEVWLMEDGAIDEAEDDIEKVAEANGIALPDEFIEGVIDNVAALLQKRGEEGAAMEQQPGPPQGGPAPTMGGMPDGMG
jgi:hypothetical protein